MMYENITIPDKINNNRIRRFKKIITPQELKRKMPSPRKTDVFVMETRQEIANILSGKDNRLLFIVGPCSIHNLEEAKEYAAKLKVLSDEVSDKILIIMRVYFEKPRTTIGWKGLINDPDLNETYDVNKGIHHARELLLYINRIGLACGSEVLDTITPQYICDLVSWSAIGARTTESQVHRQLVSGLSMPTGFKNGTGGTIKMAAEAIVSAAYTHCFMGITDDGHPAIYETVGNPDCHIILRGGADGPNYEEKYIKETEAIMRENGLTPKIMVDCSHGNSQKNHRNQKGVLQNVMHQIKNSTSSTSSTSSHITSSPTSRITSSPTSRITSSPTSIIGVMLESNIKEGKQTLTKLNYNSLLPGTSITDGCISIEETEKIIKEAYSTIPMCDIV